LTIVNNIDGKTVFVTGGSSGIGLAIAHEMAAAGARVALIARNPERLEEAARHVREIAGDGNVAHVSLDVSDRAACEKKLPELVEQLGGPDLLINCHGVTGVYYFTDTKYEDLLNIFAINVGGVYNTIQVLLPELEKKKATVVNVASVAGFLGVIGYALYSPSKFGLIGLSEVLRNELRPRGVSIRVLCPPDTDTPMFRNENITKPFETMSMSGILPVKSAEYVAKALMKGLRGKRFMIVPGFMGRLSLLVKGVLPRLVFKIVDDDLRKAQKKMVQRENQGEM